MEEQLGEYVEPVQLQVVCYRLWEKLPAGQTTIGENDIEVLEDVDTALSGYYADAVSEASNKTGVRERAIREWFDRSLITPQGVRGQVLQGHDKSQGLDNTAIWMLVDKHLVRADTRRGTIWFELAHDRLVEPVRKNNVAWFAANLSTLQQQAGLWADKDRPRGLLFRDHDLSQAETWAISHPEDMSTVEQDFLGASHEAQQALDRDRRNNRLIRGLAVVALLIAIVAAALAFWAGAERNRASAEAARANAAADLADVQAKIALSRQLAAQATSLMNDQYDLALLLSVEARRTYDTLEARSSLQSALEYKPQLTTILREHHQQVNAVAFSPDGKVLASAGCGHLQGQRCDQGLIILWATATMQPLAAPLQVTGTAVYNLAFSPDGRTLASAGHDSAGRGTEVSLWDTRAPYTRRTLSAPAPVWSLAFSPDPCPRGTRSRPL